MAINRGYRLPILVQGKLVTCEDRAHHHTIHYDSGASITLPAMTQEDIAHIGENRAALSAELDRLTVHDITTMFSAVGERWLRPDSPVRAEAEIAAEHVTGYARRMLALDYNFIGYVLRERAWVYDYLESELGGERVMDEWSRQKASWVKAFPQGLVFHSMVGNMALANAFTLLWASMTKNISLAKIPARDPITALALARVFSEVDETHPLTRAMTVGYWQRDDLLTNLACEEADVVFAWGGATSIKRLKNLVPASTPVVSFGPKWSLAVVDLDRCDEEKAAWRLAADVTFYDQEACLSPQRLFLKGASEPFLTRLQYYLEKAAAHIPKQHSNLDAHAHVSLTRLEADYRNWPVSAGRDWMIVQIDNPLEAIEHPLGRTLFVHPVQEVSDVMQYLNSSAQTLCCEPWQLGVEHRDSWGLAGVDRIVELGMSRRPQFGYTHDGMRPLTKLVRWVTLEGGVDEFYKYGSHTPASVEKRLFPWLELP